MIRTIPQGNEREATSRIGMGEWVAIFGETAQSDTRNPQVDDHPPAGAKDMSRGGVQMLGLCGEPQDALLACAADSSCRAIFDGVLYNRQELARLLAVPAVPALNDSALVLQAYMRWGEDLLEKIKGIFAIIIWDGRRGHLFCARDPLGYYPLFYARAGRKTLFSTSVAALVRHPEVSGEISRLALIDQLCFRYPFPEETCYESVNRVPAGHALRIREGEQRVWRYWNPTPDQSPVNWVRDDELDRFDELLDQAVNRCLKLGPAGIFLSGGLDSVSIAAVAADKARLGGTELPWALSLAFPHPDCNEEEVQKGVAAGLGLPQVLVPFRDVVGPRGPLMAMLELAGKWPVPMFDLWRAAYHQLAAEGRRRGCQVVLTGNGGDEWLTVSPFLAADMIRNYDLRGLYRLWQSHHRSYEFSRLITLRTLLWKFGIRPILISRMTAVLPELSPPLWERVQRRRIARTGLEWVAPDSSLEPELRRRTELYLERNAPKPDPHGYYVHEGRRALDHALVNMEIEELFESGRFTGVPVLHPYWDPDLIEWLSRTPPELLSLGRRSKGLVRYSLARRLPALGFERQKKVGALGFYKSVIAGETKPALQSLGGLRSLAKLGIIDTVKWELYVERCLQMSRRRGASGRLETMKLSKILHALVMEAWLRPRV